MTRMLLSGTASAPPPPANALLRAAIQNANVHSGNDLITFNIAGTGVQHHSANRPIADHQRWQRRRDDRRLHAAWGQRNTRPIGKQRRHTN